MNAARSQTTGPHALNQDYHFHHSRMRNRIVEPTFQQVAAKPKQDPLVNKQLSAHGN